MLVFLDGNIGSGKSSVLAELSRRGYKTAEEPIQMWREMTTNGKDILECFYESKERYGFLFQMYILLTFTKTMEQYDNTALVFVERSFASQLRVFATHLRREGLISDLEWKIYNEFYKYFDIYKGIHIYIDCPPELCEKRIRERNRKGEETVDLAYLTALDKLHKDLFALITYIRVESCSKTTNEIVDELEDYFRGIKDLGS
jgi:deoxyadenosine/deoxycytidine kinase